MKARLWKGIVVAAVALHAGMAWAGTDTRLGTGGGSELRIPVGAKSVALAWSNVGSSTGAEALFSNPAGLASAEHKTEVLFSHAAYIANMNLEYVAIAQQMGGFGAIGFSAKVLSVGDIVVTTEAAPDGTGQTINPTFATLGFTYAKQLTDRVNFGGTLYYISETVMQTSSSGAAFDFGFQYDTGYKGIRLGAAMKNFGPSQAFSGSDFERNLHLPEDDPQAANRTVALGSAEYELPSLFAGGLSWPVLQGVNTVTVHGLYQSNSFGVDEGRFGAEYGWRKTLALRVGYKYTTSDNELFGLTYGLGLRVPLGSANVYVDYAGQQVSDFFDDVQHIGVTLTF
jgi:hypothetical protein